VLWSRIEVEQAVVWREGAAASMHLRMLTGDWVLVPETPPGRWARLRARLPRVDFAHDLSEDIGTLRWWRGLAVMVALILAALGMLPGHILLDPAPAMRLDAAAQEEFRSQMIAPLATGGDSGRHMGATRLALATSSAPDRARVQMVATLAPGDSLGRLLQRAGALSGDAARASELVAGAVPLSDIAGGTRLDIVLGARAGEGRALERLALRPRFDLDLLLSRKAGALGLETHALAVDQTPLRIRGLAGPSLYRSARAAGAPVRALQQYLQALDAHISLDEIQPTDSFDLILTYRRSAGGSVEAGDLLYAGLERGGEPRARLMRCGSAGQFYDASGMNEQRATSSLMMPVASARVTSGFGMRFHPILGYSRLHAGIDLGAPYGSPIYAVADGTVAWAAPHGGHGNYVRLEHGNGFATGYGHMSRFAVSPGMMVHAGQVIGYVGSTGLSTGPHLHYEVYEGGRPVDPMSVHFTVRSGVSSGEMVAFKAKLAKLLLVRPGAALGRIGGGSDLAPLR